MWDRVAKTLVDTIQDDYAIVYMDFKVDVERLVKGLIKSGLKEVKAYHGGMPSEAKNKVDSQFRNKEFQVLVATESYEVGTHNHHVNLVLRIGCMRNMAVLVQDFGRAGRNSESSDGIIMVNESVDDQRLIYWIKECSPEEFLDKKSEYEQCWKWLYGFLAGTCLRKSLLESFESSEVFELAASGECCSSCDIPSARKFNCKETAALLLKALEEVAKLPIIKSGVSEEKVISWLRGSKRGWITSSDIQDHVDASQTYSKGAHLDGIPLKKEWWSTHLRQLVHFGLIKMSFNIHRGQNFTKASRSYSVAERGEAFLSTPYDIFVPDPDSFEDTKQKRVVARRVNNDKDSAYRNKHYLPKIREQLENSTNWFEVKEKSAYEYPGFHVPSDRIGRCPDLKKTGIGSCQRPHFMWDDCQLTKRGTSTQKVHLKIDNVNTEVWLRRAFFEGVKKCSSEGCTYTVSNRQRLSKCKEHAAEHTLKVTGNCPAQIVYVWPVEDDGRRWIGCLPGTTHNHMKPAPHVISQAVKFDIQTAVKKDCSLTTKQLQKGHGIGFIPAEKSPAALNPSRIRRERQIVLEGRSRLNPNIIPLVQVLEFEDFREEYENKHESVDEEFLAKVNEKMGKYQMEGREYLLSPSRNFAFFLAPYQAELLRDSKDLYVDITYTNNSGFPYLLNMVAFNEITLSYKAVARVLLNKQDGDAYATAISEVFGHVTKIHPSFKNGHNFRQIMVDFDQAEYNGFERSMGTEVTEKIMRGCTVHWKTSVNRVSDIVTKSKEEHSIFRHLGHAIQDVDQQAEVRLAFDVLCGKKSVIHAKHLLSPQLAAICNQITNCHWSRSTHWVKWWSRDRILKMFSKAFTLRDTEDWKSTANTNNPVESLNRQSIGEGCSNISVLMKNIYLEDRLHAVKIVAYEQNINISYETSSQEEREKKRKKRKRSRLSLKATTGAQNDPKAHLDQTPPDKKGKARGTIIQEKVGRGNDWQESRSGI